MGLCKCPKKKVTNLFCFEHRVNVCEHCLVENHNKCVVQSYLSWLADSDYDKNCSLCSTPLECKETVRLKCLHLFHWECIDTWARSLPAKTAPAGYKCRICQEVIFPTPNQTSPAIEQLRTQLQQANWARAGLGLALLPETHENGAPIPAVSNSTHIPYDSWNAQSMRYITNDTPDNARASPATALDIGDDFVQQTQFLARKPIGIPESVSLLQTKRDVDLPENKYKRRSASEWFSRWSKSQYVKRPAYEECINCKRSLCKLLLFLLILATICTIMMRIIGRPKDDDPAFDPLANPNIHIAFQQESD